MGRFSRRCGRPLRLRDGRRQGQWQGMSGQHRPECRGEPEINVHYALGDLEKVAMTPVARNPDRGSVQFLHFLQDRCE
jgi:hypothetical protein